MKKYKTPKTKQQIKYEEDNKKLFQLFSSLAIASALMYGGWKYMVNQSAKIRAKGLETKIAQTADINDADNASYENKSDLYRR